jgi:hypothetical protein
MLHVFRKTVMSRIRNERGLTFICSMFLLLLNVYICRGLFFLNFSKHMDSIEGPYMSISRYAMSHWHDLAWFPLWYTGMPFDHTYQPGLHLTVAAFASALHQSPQTVYHFITASAYTLGPVLLFALCLAATGSRGFALVTAIVYSLISPVNFLIPALAADTGGYFNPRRLWVLIKYGEGPHTTALMLLPLAILLLDRAISQRRPLFFPMAALALAGIVITNWPGSVGLAMAVAAYILSRIRARPAVHWPTFLSVCICAYLIVCPWITPSTIVSVQRNAQQSDNTILGPKHLLYVFLIALAVALLHILFRALRTNAWFQFFVYFSFLTGAVVMGYMWFRLRLLPQPWRFQLEFELGLAGAIAYIVYARFKRIGNRSVRLAVAGAFALACIGQVRTYRRFAREQIEPTDVKSTIEYRMAKAFERETGTKRVFAPGNVSLWLNMFTDVPQVVGCCDQGVPTFEHRIATYIIYTGDGAGDRDAYISTLWLRAYGAGAVGVTGRNSTEPFKPFVRPEKFRGVLRELWRENDDAIYEVPQRSPSLAHVITPADVIRRAPVNGLDIEPLERYVHALDNPDLPLAEMTWTNAHRATIRSTMGANQLLSVQETYDRGWHAAVNGEDRGVTTDALGMMVIEPRCTGSCVVDLLYDPVGERRATHIAQILGVLVCLGWPIVFAILHQARARK